MFFTSFKKWVFKILFYRSSSHFIVKTHFLKVLKVLFYFLKGIESTLKSFSPFYPTKSSYKKSAF
ncbi:hypothetical protein EC505_05420 [Helicobacter pylori]|nr:hypothetical protein EC505_05420 [Helicobacter pylori]